MDLKPQIIKVVINERQNELQERYTIKSMKPKINKVKKKTTKFM